MRRIHPLTLSQEENRNNPAEKNVPLFSRRGFLQCAAVDALAASAVPLLSRFSSAFAAESEGDKMLILYFSHSGNTRTVAEHIHSRVGGNIIEVKTVTPYPRDYDTVVDQAEREQKSDARPQIATEIPHLDAYRTVFIGFPNWWGTLPMPFFTLLEKYDLGEKTIVPFCTHEGSRFGRSERDLKRLCPRARIGEGFEVRGSRAARAQSDVDAWLRKQGLIAG